MEYGNTIENRELIRAKAKEKANGVYRFRGVAYRVRSNRVTHIAYDGKVIEPLGHFDVVIGRYEGYVDAAVKILLSF